MAKRKVVITGAGGFTARHLIARLRNEPDVFLVGIGSKPAREYRINGLDEYVQADVTDGESIRKVVEQADPTWLFHLAARFRGEPGEIYRTNFDGTIAVLEAVRTRCPACGVMVVGSAAEYGMQPPSRMPLTENFRCEPVGAYAVSKFAAMTASLDYARTQGLQVVAVRPFNLVGAGVPQTLIVGAMIQRLREAIRDGASDVAVGNVNSERDFVAVEDAVDAYVRLMKGGHTGEVFNVCSGVPTAIRTVVEALLSFSPKPMTYRVDPALIRAHDAPVSYGDSSKISRAGCFSPRVPLLEALRSSWAAGAA